MSVARLQICKIFEDLDHLLFDSGLYLSPSPMDSIWVLFYSETLKVRRIVTHRNGKLDGLQAIYNRSGHPAIIEHFRNGHRYGEVICFPSTSSTQTHQLYVGVGGQSIPFTPKAAQDYHGFLYTKEEKELPVQLYRVFTRHLHT